MQRTGTMRKKSTNKADMPTPEASASGKPAYHHGDLARALVEAGREILTEKGTDGLSLRGVAAKAGVSQAAPYSHFKSKKALLRAIGASGFAELADNMTSNVSADDDWQETFIVYGITYIEFAIQNPDIYRLMFARIDPNARSDHEDENTPEPDKLDQEATRAFRLLLQLFMTRFADRKTATTLSRCAWGLVHGLSSLITEGLIVAPVKGRRQFLRNLLVAQKKIFG